MVAVESQLSRIQEDLRLGWSDVGPRPLPSPRREPV